MIKAGEADGNDIGDTCVHAEMLETVNFFPLPLPLTLPLIVLLLLL